MTMISDCLIDSQQLPFGLGTRDDWMPTLDHIEALERAMQTCNDLAMFKSLRAQSSERLYERLAADVALAELLGIAPMADECEADGVLNDAQKSEDQLSLDSEKLLHVMLQRKNLWETMQNGFAFSTSDLPWPPTAR